MSAGYLLLSEEPLAKRLICLGGCPPLLGQLSIEAADHIAENVRSALGLDGIPSSDVAESLLKIPIEDFWTKIPHTVPMIPVVDGDVIPHQVTLRTFSQGVAVMPGKDKIESIMMGYSDLDVSQYR